MSATPGHLLTTKLTFGLYHYIVPYYMCRNSVYLAFVCAFVHVPFLCAQKPEVNLRTLIS